MDNICIVFQHDTYVEIMLAYTSLESGEVRLIQCLEENTVKLYRLEESFYTLHNDKVRERHENTAYYSFNEACDAYNRILEG